MGKIKDAVKIRRTFTISPDISAKLDLLAASKYGNNISLTVDLILTRHLTRRAVELA